MIQTKIIKIGESLVGFDVRGHADDTKAVGEDIICASVSSACYLVANTITDCIGLDANIKLEDGYMQLTLPAGSAANAQDILKGFQLHMEQIAQQYPANVKMI